MPCLLSQRKYSFHVPLNPCRVYVTVKTSSRFPGGLDVLRSPHSALSHQHFQLKLFKILESDEELLLVSFSFPEVEKVWHAWQLEWGMFMKSYYISCKQNFWQSEIEGELQSCVQWNRALQAKWQTCSWALTSKSAVTDRIWGWTVNSVNGQHNTDFGYFQIKVIQGHVRGGPRHRPDPSQGFVHKRLKDVFNLFY